MITTAFFQQLVNRNTMTRQDQNTLAAKMMGWKMNDWGDWEVPNGFPMFRGYGFTTMPEIGFEFNKDWNWLIGLYNKCMAYAKVISPEMQADEGYTLAKTALNIALSPDLNGQLTITRAYMCICDFISWFLKFKYNGH